MWSKLHVITLIPTFICMVAIVLLIGHFLKKKDEKYRLIPIQIIACILVGLEIAKQIYNIVDGYDFYTIPLHFCSLFLYFFPVMAFYKGKHKDAFRNVTLVACTMLFLFMCVYPTLIYGEDSIRQMGESFSSCHTVIYHNLVLFAFLLILRLKLYDFKTKRDCLWVLCVYALFCLVSGSMANILHTNFNSFYYCQVEPIENLRVMLNNAIGWGGQLCYVCIISIGTIILAFVSYWFLRLIDLICKKFQT